MAGDWIKVEKSTERKPEVLAIADQLHVHPYHSFGLCVAFWAWCDDQMSNGHAMRVTDVTLDTVFGQQGFTAALLLVGWLQVRNGSLESPTSIGICPKVQRPEHFPPIGRGSRGPKIPSRKCHAIIVTKMVRLFSSLVLVLVFLILKK
jgi:hypothetical protein